MSEDSFEGMTLGRIAGVIDVVTLKPGDLLVFTTDRLLSHDQTKALHDHVSAQAPDGVKCLVLSGGVAVGAVTVER